MMKVLLVLVLATHLGGCCGALKEAIRAYGTAAESSADVTAELVKRCKAAATESDTTAKQGDLNACDQAIKSLGSQKTSAAQLKSID